MVENNYSQPRYQYQSRLLVVGIMFIGCAIWLSLPMFTTQSNLTQIKGKLDTAFVDVTTVSSTSHLITSYSQKAVLTFRIKEQDQDYSVTENIGSDNRDEKYNQILEGLRKANIVSAWIKSKDTSEDTPDVFQIDADNNHLLDINSVRFDHLGVSIFLFILGLGSLTLYSWIQYPDKFRKIFRLNI